MQARARLQAAEAALSCWARHGCRLLSHPRVAGSQFQAARSALSCSAGPGLPQPMCQAKNKACGAHWMRTRAASSLRER
eukprot:366298-Chlamydomonas_euryale.AAC.6